MEFCGFGTSVSDDDESPSIIELTTISGVDAEVDQVLLSSPSSVVDTMSLTYCPMPWPSDMLQSPQRRFLWHYFIQTASTRLLCLEQDDMRRVPDFCDPFTTVLPTMALAHEPLRATVYCLAAAHHHPSIGRDMYRNLTKSASLMVTKAFEQLIPAVHHQDNFTVAVTIVAGIFLKLAGEESGRGHLRSAAKLAALFLQKSQSWTRLSAPYIQMTLALLRWCIISTACSLKPDQDLASENLYSAVKICPDELRYNYAFPFQSWTAHPLYAFSQNLINPLLQMAGILNARKHEINEPMDACSAHEHQDNGLEEALTGACQKDIISLSVAEDSMGLRFLNESMHAAASILLYTRVNKLPFTAPLVRQQVRIVLHRVSKIDAAQRVKGAALFPLFVSGCEAVDGQVRVRILDELRSLESTFAHPEDRTSALQHVWHIRDLQPGLIWPQWIWQSKLHCIIAVFEVVLIM